MDTWFAPAERLPALEVIRQAHQVVEHPVTGGVLRLTQGLLAVLNDKRQFVAVNATLLSYLGSRDAAEVLGMRLGETVGCVHADEMPGGCGTSSFCSSCGAAVATVTALVDNQPAARKCALQVQRNGRDVEVFFEVRAVPVQVDDTRLILLFLQDITSQQKWAGLERAFLHDINNTVAGLVSLVNVMADAADGARDALTTKLLAACARLSSELAAHRCLLDGDLSQVPVRLQPVAVGGMWRQVVDDLAGHDLVAERRIAMRIADPDARFTSDPVLLRRVLLNMVLNALEASPPGDEITVGSEHVAGRVRLFVHNGQEIDPVVRPRIFQRNISTKDGWGRGVGTYAMKLIGEELLGGEVGFRTGPGEGTTFFIDLVPEP